MLTLISDCHYTLAGLTQALAPLSTRSATFGEWQESGALSSPWLLVAASNDCTYTGLLTLIIAAQNATPGVRIAFMGLRGPAVFLNTCGAAPEVSFLSTQPAGVLRAQIYHWLASGRVSRRGLTPECLPWQERQTLLLALSGMSIARISTMTGITMKKVYVLRAKALTRLGKTSLRDLLLDRNTGRYTPSAAYLTALCGQHRLTTEKRLQVSEEEHA